MDSQDWATKMSFDNNNYDKIKIIQGVMNMQPPTPTTISQPSYG